MRATYEQTVQSLCNELKQHSSYCIRLNCLRFLACPARFERATYALEALKMRLINSLDNGIEVLAFGVASTPKTLGLSGMQWILNGIGRRLDGQISNLSDKPTNLLMT